MQTDLSSVVIRTLSCAMLWCTGTALAHHSVAAEFDPGQPVSFTGTVQKVSNLILNMNIYVRDASSGATIAAMSADMRGNTDESWKRAIDYLWQNVLSSRLKTAIQ